MMIYTVAETAETVSVQEFRNRIDHLIQICGSDFAACRGPQEKAACLDRARRVGAELIATTCKRARPEDWNRREVAIDRSAALIARAV